MKLDYLKGTDYSIEQKEGMYHFNSDTVLLGNFLEIHTQDRVLDVGTNNGALLLYASKSKKLYGIDLFEDVIALAKNNLARNHVLANLSVSRLQDYKQEPFDVIASNPPFFSTKKASLKNENEYLKAARHEEYLSLKDLMMHVERLLKDNGTFYLVYRPDRFLKVIEEANAHHLHLYRMQVAYASINKDAKSILLAFKKNVSSQHLKIEKGIFLDDPTTYVKGESI